MAYRRRQPQGQRVTIVWTHEATIGFLPVEMEYTITGTVSPYYPATFNDPAEGGEVEIEKVIQHHPIDGDVEIDSDEWSSWLNVELSHIMDEISTAAYTYARDVDDDPFDSD